MNKIENNFKEREKRKKRLLKWINTYYKDNENSETIFSSKIKNEIAELIYSTSTIEGLNILETNWFNLVQGIPNKKDAKEKHYIDIYYKMLALIKLVINTEDKEFLLVKTNDKTSLFHELKNIKISGSYELYDILPALEEHIRFSNKKEEKESALILLEISSKIKNKKLIEKIIKSLKSDNNLLVYKLLKNVRKLEKTSSIDFYINAFIDKITLKLTEEQVNYIEKFMNVLFEQDVVYFYNNIEGYGVINDIFIFIMNSKFINLDFVLKLIQEDKFKKINNSIDKGTIIKKIFNMDEKIKEEELFLEVLNKVIIPCQNIKIRSFLLNKLFINLSKETLEMLLELYPIINKYNDNETCYELLAELTSDTKIKQLVIPIQKKTK